MINIETLEFLKVIEDIAEKTKNGIEPFVKATESNIDEIAFYDESAKEDNGYLLVYDTVIIDDPQCKHHDVVSYYGTPEYHVWAKQDEYGKWFILVAFSNDDAQIIIEDGHWYFV